mgnify:CR=1 FL=1
MKNKSIQRTFIIFVTIILSFVIIENGAAPKKYRLTLGEKSRYDIMAPRDIVNVLLTEKIAREAADNVPPVMERLDDVPIDIINTANNFIDQIRDARSDMENSIKERGVSKGTARYNDLLEQMSTEAAEALLLKLNQLNIRIPEEDIKYILASVPENELDLFEAMFIDLVSTVMKDEVNEDNLSEKVDYVQRVLNTSDLSRELKTLGGAAAKALLKPNSIIDEESTESARTEAYNAALEDKQIIQEGSRILSYGDIVTEDKLEVLKELNLLETGGFDFKFAGGILAVVLMLSFLLILYINNFCRKIIPGTKEALLLSVIIILTLVSAWLLDPVKTLLIPAFIAPMLISILLDLRLGIIVNTLLSMAIFFITNGDQQFLFTSLIGGTIAAFIVTGANQRSKLSASGLVIAAVNAIVAGSIGLINKSSLITIANNAGLVAVNGMLSTILTIGLLPFFESTFNIITPLKLLELANPNHPLMKRLLMEAPGTYHHSLMVGNLAESAAEAINGNALLARVGAYYHDIGKLKRPNFFKENQLSDNPHDRMTPNLSTLVITSHTADGNEIAIKYKIPLAVRDIIVQHHGTTLAAYFYYKAKKADKGDTVKQEDFRYPGPRPATKEAAVVMLADSVEAAIRSMAEKTEGKMEGLIRNIIKDKLDDGQLDLCDLTLRDLDVIAKSFMHVFGGYFHERQEYPEIKKKNTDKETDVSLLADYNSETAGNDINLQRAVHESSTDIQADKEGIKTEKQHV